MKVYLIGKTKVDLFPFQGDSTHHMPGKASGSEFEKRVRETNSRLFGIAETGQELIEFAGRLCYESFDLPNPDTATNEGYVRNIISLGHESVLEHVSVTFYVEGVSRNLTHELIRHRHLSFSELSQRFVNMEEADVIVVNTCGFIDSAKKESIDTILEMAELKNTGACKKLVVAGCLAERYRAEIRREIPELDFRSDAGQLV